MGERPYVCGNGHPLANRVTTCPRCGSPGKPVRRGLWEYFALGLLVLAVAGVGVTLVGRGGTRPSNEDAAAAAPVVSTTIKLDATATTETSTTTTETPTTTATTSTTVATTTTTAPTTTAPPTTPATTVPPAAATEVSTIPAPPTTVATMPSLDGPARQALAREALVVAYTTGHAPSGYRPIDQLLSPALRARVDGLITDASYRAAGCRQQVSNVLPGSFSGTTYGFSFTIERTCARVPTAGGYQLPLVTGAFATVVLGPTVDGSYWAADLRPD